MLWGLIQLTTPPPPNGHMRDHIVDLAARLDALERDFAQLSKLTEDRSATLEKLRDTIMDMARRMLSRDEVDAHIRSLETKVDGQIGQLREKTDAVGKPNYVLAGTLVTTLFALVGGMWVVIGLKIDTSTAPLSVQIEQIKGSEAAEARGITDLENRAHSLDATIAQLATENAQSRSDREQLNSRVHQVEALIPALSTERRGQIADLSDRIRAMEVTQSFLKERFLDRGTSTAPPPRP